jgi:predicted ATPase
LGSTTARSNLLRSVAYSRPLKDDGYPFAIETISTLSKIEFESSVTFFAGGNGTGKSTLLEAIAIGTERVPVSPSGYGTLPPGIRRLARSLTFTRAALTNGGKKGWTKYFRQGFFLRAEDFLDYKRGLVREIAELRRASDEFDDQFEGYSLQLARDATAGQADKLALRYGEDLDAMSHGESFLQFFRARFTGRVCIFSTSPIPHFHHNQCWD